MPLGSSQSCTLFLIYLNDISSQLKADKAFHADDLLLYKIGSNVGNLDEELTRDTERPLDYRDTWKKKTVCSIFTEGYFVEEN